MPHTCTSSVVKYIQIRLNLHTVLNIHIYVISKLSKTFNNAQTLELFFVELTYLVSILYPMAGQFSFPKQHLQ